MVSKKTSKKDVEYAKKLGVQAYLPKPFDFAQLDNALTKTIRERKFRIKPKLRTYKEILYIKKMYKEKEEEEDKKKLHRETKNVMRDFFKKHQDNK